MLLLCWISTMRMRALICLSTLFTRSRFPPHSSIYLCISWRSFLKICHKQYRKISCSNPTEQATVSKRSHQLLATVQRKHATTIFHSTRLQKEGFVNFVWIHVVNTLSRNVNHKPHYVTDQIHTQNTARAHVHHGRVTPSGTPTRQRSAGRNVSKISQGPFKTNKNK